MGNLHLVVFVVFVVVPIVELLILFAVQSYIRWPTTIGIVLLTGVIGAFLVRRQGRSAWEAIGTTFQTGVFPGKEMGHAALVLIGGAFLLTPGFLTDIAGFSLMVPSVREVVRLKATAWFLQRRVIT